MPFIHRSRLGRFWLPGFAMSVLEVCVALYEFPAAAVVKPSILTALNCRNLLAPRSGCQKSELKGWAGAP